MRYRAKMAIDMASDRSFGLFFCALFGALAGWALATGRPWGWAALAIAAVLALLAWRAPSVLRPLNRAWFALGLVLARVVNPIVLGVLFFLVVTPVGLLMRAFGKRPLNLRYDRAATSYWIERNPRGPAPASMRDQF